MIAARVTESYASLFLTSKHDDGSRHAAIARIGAFEVRLLEMPSVNSPEQASLWVELYDRDLRVGVDSYKCSDVDEAIDAAQLLMAHATRLNNEAGEAAPSPFEQSIGIPRGLVAGNRQQKRVIIYGILIWNKDLV
jgi:hypothetical protein